MCGVLCETPSYEGVKLLSNFKISNKMTYQNAVSSAPVVLVEFYASWCPHCQRMMPVVDDVKALLGDGVPVVQLDIDENTEAANAADVQSVPTFIIYRDGKEVWRHSGEIDGNSLYGKVNSFSK